MNSAIDSRTKMKASVFIASSLDGFIARKDGGLDWLDEYTEDHGYTKFMKSVDALVMGRKTFEKVLTFPGWSCPKPVIVLSTKKVRVPKRLAGAVEVMSGSPRRILERLARRGMKDVYVDGGKTIQGFLRAGLIGRMIVTTVPKLLGSGIPLFGPLARTVSLNVKKTRRFKSGLVQNEYEISRGR